jgi:hypothetical protein
LIPPKAKAFLADSAFDDLFEDLMDPAADPRLDLFFF